MTPRPCGKPTQISVLRKRGCSLRQRFMILDRGLFDNWTPSTVEAFGRLSLHCHMRSLSSRNIQRERRDAAQPVSGAWRKSSTQCSGSLQPTADPPLDEAAESCCCGTVRGWRHSHRRYNGIWDGSNIWVGINSIQYLPLESSSISEFYRRAAILWTFRGSIFDQWQSQDSQLGLDQLFMGSGPFPIRADQTFALVCPISKVGVRYFQSVVAYCNSWSNLRPL